MYLFKCSIETAGAATATPKAFYYSYSLQIEPETACCNTTDIVTLEHSAGAHHFWFYVGFRNGIVLFGRYSRIRGMETDAKEIPENH